MRKSITFPLDPSGKHSVHHSPNNTGTIQRTSTATVRSKINFHLPLLSVFYYGFISDFAVLVGIFVNIVCGFFSTENYVS